MNIRILDNEDNKNVSHKTRVEIVDRYLTGNDVVIGGMGGFMKGFTRYTIHGMETREIIHGFRKYSISCKVSRNTATFIIKEITK